MPIPIRRDKDVCSEAETYSDTYSLSSRTTTTINVRGGLPTQLVRKSARKGFPFNIMTVGPPGTGKSTLLSALFGRNLDIPKSRIKITDPLNPPVALDSKTFDIVDGNVKVKLTIHESRNYGEAICFDQTHKPLVHFIDTRFVDYYKQESGVDRRNIQDNMVHCLFFFISAFEHGLSKLDIDFLKAVHRKVNIIPIISWAEALNASERALLKRRIRDEFEKNDIHVYQMDDPDIEDPDDVKQAIKEIQNTYPFAVASIDLNSDYSLADRGLDWGQIDSSDKDHSDYLHLKNMFDLRMASLGDSTRELFYEEYRSKMLQSEGSILLRS